MSWVSRRRAGMASDVMVTRSPIQTLESRVNSRLGKWVDQEVVRLVEGGDQAASAAYLVVAQPGHHDLGELRGLKISEKAPQKSTQRILQPDV